MEVLRPPEYNNDLYKDQRISLFIAGSIEMDTAEKWQQWLIEEAEKIGSDIIIFDPRRPQWDSSWVQSIHNEQFNEQVTWELDHIEMADYVLVYFDPNTKSPVSLLELGILAGTKPHQTVVYCPYGFWRKGNVDILCKRAGIEVFEDRQQILQFLKFLAGKD